MLGGAGVGLRPLPSYVRSYQAAIINGFTPQTLVRLIRAGLATDNAGPPLALSPRLRQTHWGRPTPARRLAQAVAALPAALVGLPFGTPPLRPARWLPARGQCASRGLGRLCCSTKNRGLSAGLSLIGSPSILAARQENPNHLTRQVGISARSPAPSHWASGPPCRFVRAARPRQVCIVTTSATWCSMIADARIQAVSVEAGRSDWPCLRWFARAKVGGGTDSG
jgi:hypothetical protein